MRRATGISARGTLMKMPASRPATPSATHGPSPPAPGRGSVNSVTTTISVIASVPNIDSGSLRPGSCRQR